MPVFLYPREQQRNMPLPGSPDITVSAWKDEGIRPLTVRLAELHWADPAVADLR